MQAGLGSADEMDFASDSDTRPGMLCGVNVGSGFDAQGEAGAVSKRETKMAGERPKIPGQLRLRLREGLDGREQAEECFETGVFGPIFSRTKPPALTTASEPAVFFRKD